MRILAIRGENLASLREPFALELDREPLRSAGLFAITGETGAGKSTILDALCLALYDKFPRVVAPGANEGAPDPSGETLGGGDPRAILRRGAGRGFAEADFVARDGLRYRAKCELNRARGKSSGRLQNRNRALYRIDESGEIVAPVESGVEAVNKRVVELTDLTFDQFLRTALLAQGDFDAFLRAEERQRAELLEKITGAEIYGLLSKRAHEAATAARRNLAALEQRRADIGLMTEDERSALAIECGDIETRRVALADERASVAEGLRRHDALASAQAKLTQALAARDEAQRALEQLAPQRDMLAQAARAEPLRARRDELRRAEKAIEDAKNEAALAYIQAREAQTAFDGATANEKTASEALSALEREFAQFAPIWAQASELDARISAMATEEADARRAAQEAARRAQAKRAEAIAAQTRQAELRQDAEAARAELTHLAPARALRERWSEIDDWLTKRAEISQKKAQALDDAQKALTDLRRGEAARAALEAADAKDRAARDAISSQIAERDAAFAALDEQAAQQRAEEIFRELDALQALIRLSREFGEARTRSIETRELAERLDGDSIALADRLAALSAARDAELSAKAEAERFGELADAVADPHVARLRSALDDDSPCPVCGARDHPFAHAPDAAREIVETLRARREDARRALAETENAIVVAREEEARLRALKDDAARRGEEAAATATRAAKDYEALRANRSTIGGEAIAAIGDAAPQLAAMLERLTAERAANRLKLDAARRMRDELGVLRNEFDAKGAAIEHRRVEREAAIRLLQTADAARVKLDAEMAGWAERIVSLDRSLAPYLSSCEISSADLDRDETGARRRLEQAGARYEVARLRFEKFSEDARNLDLRVATLEAESAIEAKRDADAASAHVARRENLDALNEQRASLLGGEATAAHRARFEDARRGAAQSREAMRDALGAANAAAAAAAEHRIRCDEISARLALTATAEREAFAKALAACGFDGASAAALLDRPPSDIASMRNVVDAAQVALAAAASTLLAREADLADAMSIGAPQAARDELAAREAELAGALDVCAGRLGELRATLAQDDKARIQAQTLATEIEESRDSSKIWDEIDAAIGSSSGDKFRRFAQSVTLEQLVALANLRLALLAPRYRLERAGEMGSLGLQIVDRDLGDERRSTRSLSGGERFLASLALALALAGLEGRDSFVDTLFIDEGFGALDLATLDVAIDALENLQGQGRKVGVISHVESLQHRITTKVCVERRGGGTSAVRVVAPGFGGQ